MPFVKHTSVSQGLVGVFVHKSVKACVTLLFGISMLEWKTHDTNLASVMSPGACSTCSATLKGNTPSGTILQSSHNLKLKSGASFAADQTSPVNIF